LAAVSATPELGSRTATVTTSDRAINGAESAIAQGWNPVLVAPRAVAVHTIGETDQESLAGVVPRLWSRDSRCRERGPLRRRGSRHASTPARTLPAGGRAGKQFPLRADGAGN
jgi:hypothetical protein